MHMSLARTRLLAVLSLFLALAACTTPALHVGQSVPPGYLYKAKFLNIHSPAEKGWSLVGAAESGIQFARHGDRKEGTFAAQVATFPLPEFQDDDVFLDFIKRSFQTDTDHKRFTIIKSSFKLSDARKYLCVRVFAVVEDRQAPTLAKHHRKLLLQSFALYCRHPLNKLAGFAIIYSHRGKSIYPGLEKKANAFITGVQVPAYK